MQKDRVSGGPRVRHEQAQDSQGHLGFTLSSGMAVGSKQLQVPGPWGGSGGPGEAGVDVHMGPLPALPTHGRSTAQGVRPVPALPSSLSLPLVAPGASSRGRRAPWAHPHNYPRRRNCGCLTPAGCSLVTWLSLPSGCRQPKHAEVRRP